MSQTLELQFVSDIMCPWCRIGLGNLETAIARLGDSFDIALTFEPFELNPQMPAEGQNTGEHLAEKYGSTPEQSKQNRAMIQARGREVDFDFNFTDSSRMWNSFDAHRLLHWAKEQGKQAELKKALFKAHFTDNRNMGDHTTLVDIAGSIGLDQQAAKAILESQQFADDVRQRQQLWHNNGIHSVPTVIVNNQYAITGGQPAEVFERALRDIAAKAEI